MPKAIWDCHRHLGKMPAFPFYGGPPSNPDTEARGSVAQLIKDLDEEGTERCLIIPNYGVPDPAISFGFNELVVEAAQTDDRIRAAIWMSPLERDKELTDKAMELVDEDGVAAIKLSFLLGGSPDDPDCQEGLDRIFAAARERDYVIHVHTSPGGASDINEVGKLVERYGDENKIHLVHLGGGMSGHIKMISDRFFNWISEGKKVYTDASWAIGFAPRWLLSEIDSRGIGEDRVLFASDEPWSDRDGELAKMVAAARSSELSKRVFETNFHELYG